MLCGHNLGVFDVSQLTVRSVTPPEVNGVWNFKVLTGHPNKLISGTYNGLVLFKKQLGKWEFENKIEGFKESSRFIEFDDKGYLWISQGYNGVYRLKLNEDLTKVIEVDTFKCSTFKGNHTALVLSKVSGKCIFSGSDGVYGINAQGNDFERLKQYDAFFNTGNFPTCINEDQYHNQWCFFNERVCVLRYLEDGSYKKIEYPFLSLDRKLVNGFEYIHIADANNVFLGVEDGFAHYSVEDYKDYKTPFKVHLRSFKGYGDSIIYQLNSIGDTIVQKVIPEYSFRKNAFKMDYAAAFYENNEVFYSTYLMNFDFAPQPWDRASSRSLSNLHEGKYEFQIRARNAYGVIAKPIKFKFVITPPWYRSIIAKIGYVIISIFVLLVTLYFFNKRIELSKQKETIKQKERFRVKEEQLQNAALLSEKEMIRMRNEKLRGEMIFKEKELANSTIHLIQKNELLLDIKKQLKKIITISERNESERKMKSLIKKLDKDIDNENNWEVFEMHFGQVHDAFFKSLNQLHPTLSIREQKLCAYIKMGMSSKEIASLMNVTSRAVENNRYMLRQKLGILQGENLAVYISKLHV